MSPRWSWESYPGIRILFCVCCRELGGGRVLEEKKIAGKLLEKDTKESHVCLDFCHGKLLS